MAMVGRKTSLLLAATLGLLASLASTPAPAAIIATDPISYFRGTQGDTLPRFAGEFSDFTGGAGASDGMTPAAPCPSAPSDEQQNPVTLRDLEGLSPSGAAAGRPSSASHGGGNGSSNVAVTSDPVDLSEPPFRTGLPSEANAIMPTGPPFELLRPPRYCGPFVAFCG